MGVVTRFLREGVNNYVGRIDLQALSIESHVRVHVRWVGRFRMAGDPQSPFRHIEHGQRRRERARRDLALNR